MNKEKAHRWCFTIWDMNTILQLKNHLMTYYVFGQEICPTTHKLHFQGYIEFKKEYALGSVKRILNDKQAHCEIARENREVCTKYCLKEKECVRWIYPQDEEIPKPKTWETAQENYKKFMRRVDSEAKDCTFKTDCCCNWCN